MLCKTGDELYVNYDMSYFYIISTIFSMNPSFFEPNTFWSFFVGMVFFWLAQITVHPGAVQRFIAVSSFDNAKMYVIWISKQYPLT